MRKQFILALMVFIYARHMNAQSNGVVVGGKWADQVSISDVNGRPFENRYADVNGSPYFNEVYKFANIKLSQGRSFTNIKSKIDLAAQELYFITSNGAEAFIQAGMVKEVSYADTTPGGILYYKFQTGFPAADKQTGNNFYQLLSEGRCSFIKAITKTIAEKKNELSGEVSKDFETTENYYLFVNGEMKRLKKDKGFIMAVLSDRQPQLSQFIDANKLNFKNTDHLVKLFNYYNSL